jgi:hypothetical protein
LALTSIAHLWNKSVDAPHRERLAAATPSYSDGSHASQPSIRAWEHLGPCQAQLIFPISPWQSCTIGDIHQMDEKRLEIKIISNHRIIIDTERL